MTKLLLFCLLALNQAARAGEINCSAPLSLAHLRTGRARFQADLDRLSAPFSDLKIQLFSENFESAAGGLPSIAKPATPDRGYFRVEIHAHLGDRDYDFTAGFSIVPRDGEHALEAGVATEEPSKTLPARETLRNLELMSLFVALSATPYSRFLQITQKVDSALGGPTSEAFKSIRLSKIQGLSDRLAVRLHWPWLVESLGEDGFPILYNTVKVDAFRDDERNLRPSLPEKADHFLVEYDYFILDAQLLH